MKKITAILLCAVLALCLLPVTALAGETETTYWVEIAGENFTSGHKVISCGDGTATYEPETHTLTLENATITADTDAGIGATDSMDLKIILIGKNVVKGGKKGASSGAGYAAGIFLYNGNLEISGDGSLEVSGGVTENKDQLGYGYGICVRGVTVKSGTITATGLSCGVSAHDVTVDGGSLTAISNGNTADLNGIYIWRKLTVNGGSVKAIREINSENNLIDSYGINGDVVITGGSFTAEVQNKVVENQREVFELPANAKAMSKMPDITGLTDYRWRVASPGDYSEEALPDTLTIGTYFEIMKKEAQKAPVYVPAGEVHQITSAEKPVVSEETNPNTGADYSSILCAGAVLVLAGAVAVLKGKKH